jgi:hypothetical protein
VDSSTGSSSSSSSSNGSHDQSSSTGSSTAAFKHSTGTQGIVVESSTASFSSSSMSTGAHIRNDTLQHDAVNETYAREATGSSTLSARSIAIVAASAVAVTAMSAGAFFFIRSYYHAANRVAQATMRTTTPPSLEYVPLHHFYGVKPV